MVPFGPIHQTSVSMLDLLTAVFAPLKAWPDGAMGLSMVPGTNLGLLVPAVSYSNQASVRTDASSLIQNTFCQVRQPAGNREGGRTTNRGIC
jgi:hypothetical protein